jgi:hypothetical protein
VEKGNHTSSPGFSDEERARWGLPAVRLWGVTYPPETEDPEETAYLSGADDAPEATAETDHAPQMTADAAEAPQMTAETADAPQMTAETDASQITAQRADPPETRAQTADAPGTTADASGNTVDAPETTADASGTTADASGTTADAPETTADAPETTAEPAGAAGTADSAGEPTGTADTPEVTAELEAMTTPMPVIRARLAESPAGSAPDAPTPADSAVDPAPADPAPADPAPVDSAPVDSAPAGSPPAGSAPADSIPPDSVPPAPVPSHPVRAAPAQRTSLPAVREPSAGRPPAQRTEPSWPEVVVTTARLWVGRRAQRRRPTGPAPRTEDRRLTRLTQLTTLAAVVVLAAVVGILLARDKPGQHAQGAQHGQNGPVGQGSAANPVQTAQAVRAQAAAWIMAQVSRATIVSCDPVMCAELQGRGWPASNLDVLRPGTSDPLDSEVIVATGVLRSQFGGRLTSVYAPDVLASFGFGSAGIQVRPVAPDGAPAYVRQLSADVTARASFGRELLHNPDVVARAAARQQLEHGQVDARLITVIGTVAKTSRLRILSFGDGAPGASAGLPLRSAMLGATTGGSPGTTVLGSVRSFLEGQHPPYLPAVARVVRLQNGAYALNVQFAVPDPLGLLATGHSLVTIPAGG